MKHILIVKTSAIGDVIQALPIVEYLHHRFPQAEIDWLVEKGSSDLLAAHPLLTRVLRVDTKLWRRKLGRRATWRDLRATFRQLREKRYDLVLDLQGNCKSGVFTLFARAQEKVGFGWKCVPEKPNLLATGHRYEIPKDLSVYKRYLQLAQTHLRDETSFTPRGVQLKLSADEQSRLEEIVASPSCQFMVAFASRWKNKQLPREVLVRFLALIEGKYHPGFLFPYGNADEQRDAEWLVSQMPGRAKAVGGMSLPLWQAVMARMQCVIAMDSAALHLCATTATPTFSLFGPSSSQIYRPSHSDRHHAIQGSCPYGKKFSARCPKLRTCPTGACMHHDPQKLFAAFSSWHENLK